MEPIGIILSGGPQSVYEEGAAQADEGLLSLGIPVLGICYGFQLLAHELGGRVESSSERKCKSSRPTSSRRRLSGANPI